MAIGLVVEAKKFAAIPRVLTLVSGSGSRDAPPGARIMSLLITADPSRVSGHKVE